MVIGGIFLLLINYLFCKDIIYLLKFITMIKNLILTLCFFMTAFYTFAQREAALITRTHWLVDVEKMTDAHQTKYANFDAKISTMSAENRQAAIDKKAEDEMIFSIMGGIEMRFDAGGNMQMYIVGSQAAQGTWKITSNTLTVNSEQGEEEYQLTEISENILTVARANGDMIYYKAKNPTKTQATTQTKNNSNTKNSAPISYKGMSLTMPGNTINFQLSYKAEDLKIESFSLGMVSTYCDCKVETKEGYETGNCMGEQFNEGNKGMYIKNSKGVVVVGYYTSGQATPAMLLAPTDALLEQALTSDVQETEKMAALLAEWYKLW